MGSVGSRSNRQPQPQIRFMGRQIPIALFHTNWRRDTGFRSTTVLLEHCSEHSQTAVRRSDEHGACRLQLREQSLFWEAGSACGSIRCTPRGTKAAPCLQTKLSRNHSPRRRLLHWVMECDGARQELDTLSPQQLLEPARVQVFGQCFQTHGHFPYCSVMGQGLDLLVLVGLFQL